MSGFSNKQIQSLRRKLDRRHVQTRQVAGRTLDYVEGWFAIAEANAIFGFDGWDRETTHFERVYERSQADGKACAYIARVKIRVRSGDTIVVREGTGWGSATAKSCGEAHERSLKAAETDATKRALATFGNRFGLGLYDKDQSGVTGHKMSIPGDFSIRDAKGNMVAEGVSSETFCRVMRQLLEKTQDAPEARGLWQQNIAEAERVRLAHPSLTTSKGQHYIDILIRLVNERAGEPTSVDAIEQPQPQPLLLKPSRIAPGPRIDKSALAIACERRLRDKAHLKFVAGHACLVCGRIPSHAHHLTFAQPRGLSLKVSDEFTVPLCAVHHDECHRSGDERGWWTGYGCEPIATAAELWEKSHGRGRQPDVTPPLRSNQYPQDMERATRSGFADPQDSVLTTTPPIPHIPLAPSDNQGYGGVVAS